MFLQDMLFSYRICREITYHVTQHNMLFLDEPTLNAINEKSTIFDQFCSNLLGLIHPW